MNAVVKIRIPFSFHGYTRVNMGMRGLINVSIHGLTWVNMV